MAESQRADWTVTNIWYLALMTFGYIFGEIAHFLINTTSKEVARDVEFGNLACYFNETFESSDDDNHTKADFCKNENTTEAICKDTEYCYWDYSGSGIEYQVLAGPAFIAVFTFANLITGLTSDRIAGYSKYIGRHTLMALGVIVFSLSLFLMGFSTSYWQLVLLRMGIAAGEAVCRPVAGSMLFELFSPSGRGLANGIFSWGVYYGYSLAFVLGIYMTQADILGYGWRSVYVICAIPGIFMGIIIGIFLRDPRYKAYQLADSQTSDTSTSKKDDSEDQTQEPVSESFGTYLKNLFKSFFLNPSMILLLLAACVRHTGGYCWAYNTRLYFGKYYPDFDDQLGWWIFADSLVGGSFGVFFGGFFSDRIVKRLGLHSRLWVLSAFTLLSVPFACLTLYFEPPTALVMLMLYYFCAETWFAILFTVIVEIVNQDVKAISIALFLFIMNNIGGNLPVIVSPIEDAIGYRQAIYLVWPGAQALSAVLFFIASIPLKMRNRA